MLAEMFILRLEAIKQDSREFGSKQHPHVRKCALIPINRLA